MLKELQGQKTGQEEAGYITLSQLFNESFMSKYSSHENFEAFLEKGNFQAETREEIENIPAELFDRHVARETSFADWKSMLATANREHGAE